MLTQGRRWLILFLKLIVFHSKNRAKTKSIHRVSCSRRHDLHVRARLGHLREEGCEWAEWTVKIDQSITICNSRRFNRLLLHVQ